MDFRWLLLIPLPILFWILFELIKDEAIPIPLPKASIRKMLNLARVKKNEVVYDLGSGDGRALSIAAKEFRAKAIGVEKNRLLVWLSRRFVNSHEIKIIRNDIFKENLRNADVILIYLSHKLTQKLKPKFEKELRKGTRIVSASHPIVGWKEANRIRTGHFYSYLYKI